MRFIRKKLIVVFGLWIGLFCLNITHPALADEAQADQKNNTINLPLKDIQRLATAIAQIKRYYVEPVNDDKLFNYAIAGMLSNLDPHSDFLDADAVQDLQMATTGKFGGIGIEVVPENGFIKIISPIDDTPAFKAGVKAGDLIVRINGKLVGDLTLRQAIDLIRGDPGTKVHLTILRKNTKKPLELDLTREIIKIQTVKSQLLDNQYGYIRLSFFQNETKRDLVNAINQLQKQTNGHLAGIILDLRDNPGGLLDSAVDVTNMFLDSKHLKYGGLIVYTKGRISSSDIKAIADGSDVLHGLPMVVMINGGSASASEIVAGALQDQKRATLTGEKSFGKGSVQTVLPVDNNSMIKLTTALYYTPSGRSIQAKGIVPDIDIPDLQIPKANKEDNGLLITEADLNKHLTDNSTGAQPTPGQAQTDGKVEDLLYKDFQLYQALNILKGITAVK